MCAEGVLEKCLFMKCYASIIDCVFLKPYSVCKNNVFYINCVKNTSGQKQ